MRPKPSSRQSSRRRPQPTVVVAIARPGMEPLERRELFTSVSLASQMQVGSGVPKGILANLSDPTAAGQTLVLGGSQTQAPVLTDPNVPGSIATFETSKGNIVVALTDQATPQTVANFEYYANTGLYSGTVFHRSAFFSATDTTGLGVGGSAANPANIIQGGGYTLDGSALTHIATQSPVPDEFSTESFGDLQGTIAMANAGADTATSEFFFNNTDNTATFDATTPLKYTVFGHVLTGSSIVSTISTLPTTTVGTFNTVPIAGLTASQIAAGAPVGASNLVYTYGVAIQDGTTYTATSSDPTLVTPTIANGVLSFKYATGGQTGTATISVTGTNLYDGTSATATFAVTVPPASSTTTGPAAGADTVAAAVTGVATVIHPLTNDTDPTAALNPATVTVTTAPTASFTATVTAADGTTSTVTTTATATVDATTGDITYTAPAGFTGDDTFQYTVADTAGVVSAATTVSVHVVPTPTVVTVGAGASVKSLLITQPDGTVGRFAITGGSAQVTFSAGDTTVSAPKGGVQSVSGAGATISGIAITNVQTFPSVSLNALGKGTMTLGGMTDTGGLRTLDAGSAALTGTMTLGGVRTLRLRSASHANITLGEALAPTSIFLPNAVDTALSAGAIQRFQSQSWTVDDGGSHVVQAFNIDQMVVTGLFADTLAITNTGGYGLVSATVGGASAPWELNAAIYKATVKSPTAGWSLSDGSLVRSLTVQGDLLSTVSAAEITQMVVTGAMTNATVETSADFNLLGTQIDKLTVGKAMTDSVIFSAGNVNSVTAGSMTSSRIYAGVNLSVAQAAGLPNATTDLSAEATIKSVRLTAAKDTFASSEIAAYKLGSVQVGQVTIGNSGTAFGLSAHSFGSLSSTLNPGGRVNLDTADLRTAGTLAAVVARKKIVLTDFAIKIY